MGRAEAAEETQKPDHPAVKPCDNCQDGTGWTRTFMIAVESGTPVLVWFACANCNDDEEKPLPAVCDGCGLKVGECGGHEAAPDGPESWKPTP